MSAELQEGFPRAYNDRGFFDFVEMVDRSEWGDVEWQGHTYPAPRGFTFFTANFEDGVQGPEWEEHWHIRLFRTSAGSWYRPVHELVMLDGYPEHVTRNTVFCPKAPRSAYLIHSKMGDVAPAATELYVAIGAKA